VEPRKKYRCEEHLSTRHIFDLHALSIIPVHRISLSPGIPQSAPCIPCQIYRSLPTLDSLSYGFPQHNPCALQGEARPTTSKYPHSLPQSAILLCLPLTIIPLYSLSCPLIPSFGLAPFFTDNLWISLAFPTQPICPLQLQLDTFFSIFAPGGALSPSTEFSLLSSFFIKPTLLNN